MAIKPPKTTTTFPTTVSSSVGKFTTLLYYNGSTYVSVSNGSGGGGGGGSWGSITGTLSEQTDLNSTLTSINSAITNTLKVYVQASVPTDTSNNFLWVEVSSSKISFWVNTV